MWLLLVLSVVVTLAACAELLNLLAGDFLTGMFREDDLKQSIARAEKDVAESRRKLETLQNSLRSTRDELTRARDNIADVEQQIQKRQTAEPVLLMRASPRGWTQRRFRAPITRALRDGPDTATAQLWRHPFLLEIAADSLSSAQSEARRQFPREQGYTLGAFAEAPRADAAREVAA